ncbi:class I SAM-dependent methyltransferase [Amycolatopsis minnesotensis]|uniref:class I SAM-dependent DNA methyltransferase n=1 Tax=Amycolatopsis minnesotensis TaxID=337894 RepID=UPI0031D1041F
MTETSSHLNVTAGAYGAVADLYFDLARDDMDSLPLDRAMIGAFADLVRPAAGLTGDLGCGPGQMSAMLTGMGLDVLGVDLTPEMIDIARAHYPGPRFEVGSMDALDLADGALVGIVSWYSVIHALPTELPKYFAEFRRVLAADGHLLIAFFESEDGKVEPFDHKVTTAYRWPIDEIRDLAHEAGFTEVGRMLRAPGEEERKLRRGHLLLRAVSGQSGQTETR